ncbi:MAG: OmpA family protein [Nannocystaceae bacterium]|nr:OmpA family protein [Nannocystaceae bacterium]
MITLGAPMFRTAPLALTLALTAGCVTKSKHDATVRALEDSRAALARSHDDAQAQREHLRAREGRIAELELALDELRAQAAAVQQQRDEVAAQLAAAQAEAQSLQGRAQDAERQLADVIKRRAALKDSLDKLNLALAELGTRQLAAERRVAEYRDMIARFRSLIDAGKLDVRIVDGRMVLTMPMDILFASGSTKLSADGKAALAEVGGQLASMVGRRFAVEGHTDDVPIHNERFASNWELASGRALVVVHTLLAAGMAPAQLAATSYGEFAPRVPNRDDDARALNRRIEIALVPDLAGLPGNEELERLARPTGVTP